MLIDNCTGIDKIVYFLIKPTTVYSAIHSFLAATAYMRSTLYAIARPSVRPSVCHTGESVKNG